MFVIIGMVIVLGAVVGGYLMEKGNLLVLMQPAELLIIGGAAIGTLLIANPLPVVIRIFKGILATLSGSKYSDKFYLENLKMLHDLFQHARKNGMVKLEEDVEKPQESALFKQYPKVLKDHHLLYFLCDTLRTSLSGVVPPHELDALMEADLDVHHHEASVPVAALTTVADALPGLGIVAAVLGVVITMGALGGPPEEIGKKVAAALVGTFLGILLCYGFVAPLAGCMTKANDSEAQFYGCMRVALVAFAKGLPPILAVEFARRSIPEDIRPTFQVLEAAMKARPAEAGAAAEAPAAAAAA
jgi:chemotaxis protein MotA